MSVPPPPRPESTSGSAVADVLIPVAVDTAYSYRAPADLKLEPGAFVRVPLGTRHATGVVWAVRQARGDNLKAVAAVRDWPPLRKPLRDFVDWVARWTLSPRGMVLRMAVRAPRDPRAARAEIRRRRDRQAASAHDRGARPRALGPRRTEAPTPKAALAERAGCSAAVIDGLVEDGALKLVELPAERRRGRPRRGLPPDRAQRRPGAGRRRSRRSGRGKAPSPRRCSRA